MLKGLPTVDGRPGASMPPKDLVAYKKELQAKHGDLITDEDVISSCLYPNVFDDFVHFRVQYGPVWELDTRTFFAGPIIGREMHVSDILYYAVRGRPLMTWGQRKY